MIGQLNKRVEVFKNVKVINDRGGFSERPEKVGEVWASLQPLSSSETLEHRKMNSRVNTKIFIRFNPEINDENFFKYKGVTYEIESIVDPLYKNSFLEIEAVGGVGDREDNA